MPYSPATISKTFAGVCTVKQAIETKAPSLLRLAREEGCSRQQVEALIMAHLLALDAFLKQKNGLSPEEIELIAEEVVNTYGYMLTFADINVIFRNAKIGEYGELYGNLSCPKIMKWFKQYANERCETAYQMSREEDNRKYGVSSGRSGKEVLTNLGYSIVDGKIVIDEDKVNATITKREAERQHILRERQEKIDRDNDYMRYKLQLKH